MQCKIPVLMSWIKLIHKRLKIYCLRSYRLNRQAWWGGWNRLNKGRVLRLQYDDISLRRGWTGYRRHSASRLAASASFTTIYNGAAWNFEHATSLVEVGCTPHIRRWLEVDAPSQSRPVSSHLRLHACQSCQNSACNLSSS